MIGLVSRTLWPKTFGGASKYGYLILKSFKKTFKIKTYTWEEINEKNIIKISVPKIKVLGSLLFSLKAARAINKDKDIDLVLINQFWSEYTPLFLKKPYACLIHDLPQRNSILLWSLKKIALNAKKIFYESELTYKNLIKLGVPKNNLIYTPPGVDDELRKGKCEKKPTAKNELMFLHVSRLAPNKDLITIIRALSMLKDIKFKLFVVGQRMIWTDYYKEVTKEINKLNLDKNIILLGKVSDKKKIRLFKCADLYLHASYYGEGFGIPIVEAQAAGVPVIASDLFEKTGVIKNNRNGLVFKRRDPDDLAKKINAIIKNKELRKKLIKNGKSFSKAYSWNKSLNTIKNQLKI